MTWHRRFGGPGDGENGLSRSRRPAAGLKQFERRSGFADDERTFPTFDARHLGPVWDPVGLGSDHPTTPTVDLDPADALPAWTPPGVPRFVSPILVVVAAVSILEGYKWLNVVSTGGWQPSAAVFVSFAVPLALVLARPRLDGRRVVAVRAVVVASLIMLTSTVLALLVDQPPVTHLMGASDLLFAVTALGVALVNERVIGWGPKGTDSLPGALRDQGRSATVR